MKTRLPIFALAVFAAAVVGWTAAQGVKNADGKPDPAAPIAPSDAARHSNNGDVVIPDSDAFLLRAIAALNAAGSIEAKVRQRVDLFDRELIGAGNYAQQGSGVTTRLRLEMRMRTDRAATELVQVCNGETLWTFNAADGLRTLRRVDIDRVIDALRGGPGARPGDGFARPNFAGAAIGLGGLPWMVEGLRQYCRFAPAESGRLGELDVFIVRGTWRTDKLLPLLRGEERERVAAGGTIDVARLPPHLPDGVAIYLGRDDLFPYRFDYTRTQPRDESPATSDDDPASSTPPAKTIVSLEFYEVLVGAAIPAERFTYKPGQNATDDTGRYIERMKASAASE